MLLGWFDARAAVEFANATAAEIRKLIPPSDAEITKKQFEKRKRTLERIVLKARAFGRDQRLNVYKKSKLANTLRWSMLDAGYGKAFVDEVVQLVLVNL